MNEARTRYSSTIADTVDSAAYHGGYGVMSACIKRQKTVCKTITSSFAPVLTGHDNRTLFKGLSVSPLMPRRHLSFVFMFRCATRTATQ